MTINVDVTLFYANWCGYCNQFKPEWKKIKDEIIRTDGKFNGVNITFHEFEDSQLTNNPAKIQGREIRGYPSIKITVSNKGKTKEYEYEGKRLAVDLMSHLTKGTLKNQ